MQQNAGTSRTHCEWTKPGTEIEAMELLCGIQYGSMELIRVKWRLTDAVDEEGRTVGHENEVTVQLGE